MRLLYILKISFKNEWKIEQNENKYLEPLYCKGCLKMFFRLTANDFRWKF